MIGSSTGRKALGALMAGALMVVLAGGPVKADERTTLEERLKKLEKVTSLIEKLQKDNEDLRKQLEASKAKASTEPQRSNPYLDEVKQRAADLAEKQKLNSIIDAYLKEKDDKKKSTDQAKALQKEAEGYKMGTDLGMSARWRPDQGLYFETPNKDFQSHLGFFFQWDTVSFTQSDRLEPANQIGNLQDGTYFRRIRPLWDGHAYDTIEWDCILALEQVQSVSPNNQNALVNLDVMWAGLYNLPILGRLRFGHMKVPQGLEGNQMTSSRAMTFMENAAYTDAFYNVFGTGVQIANNAFDNRMSWQLMGYRNDFRRANVGADFGDGAYCATGRVSGLLIDEDQDRHLLHVGLSGTYRKAEKADNSLGVGGNELVRYRARPELRDAIGGFGDGQTLPGDAGRLVDTGNMTAISDSVIGTEFLYLLGPLSFQAEYALASVQSVALGTGTNRTVAPRSFSGGYGQVSYFLTGETRNYDKSFGTGARNYVTPFTPFWVHSAEGGGWTTGLGAIELAARYSYLNLNDGPIQGGVMGGLTVGLNWYLNMNFKIQMEYVHNNRWDKTTTPTGTQPGYVDGFGTRVQFQF